MDGTTELPDLPKLDVRSDLRNRVAVPVKRIHSEGDVDIWRGTEAHDTILLFLARISSASIGQATRLPPWDADVLQCRMHSADAFDHVLALLQELDVWTAEIEPQQRPQRFGNLSFRTWGERLTERIGTLHDSLLPEALKPLGVELAVYFRDSFGSFQRIDYGTGHELNFIAWLCLLHRVGFFPGEDAEQRLALEIFPAYLRVVWHLQDRYALEPAGSHGVWGLDDYQFVPYIIGAAQMQGKQDMSPVDVISMRLYPFTLAPGPRAGPRLSLQTTLTYEPPSMRVSNPPPVPNLYISSLARIHSLKRGPFNEHSPILTDISQTVPNWDKVHAGMLRMYDAECMSKFPVVQHFCFGGVGYTWPQDAVPHTNSPTKHTMGLPGAMPTGPHGAMPTGIPGATGFPAPGAGTAFPGRQAPTKFPGPPGSR